jgi:hypothetical protein
MKLVLLFWLIVQVPTGWAVDSDSRKISNLITQKDLGESCAAKFLEIYLQAETDEQAGMALMKLFFLVDSEYLKRAMAKTSDPKAFGLELGTVFREYCENTIPVTVQTAVKQAILALEDPFR